MSVHNQLGGPGVLQHSATALCTPSMRRADMECCGPHTRGRGFLRHVIEESIRIEYAHAEAHAVSKGSLGPKQHNGMGVAGGMLAPLCRMRGHFVG